MTLRSARLRFFPSISAKNSENAVDFSRRGALPNRENVYNEGKFFVFPRFRSFIRFVGRAALESKSVRIEGRR